MGRVGREGGGMSVDCIVCECVYVYVVSVCERREGWRWLKNWMRKGI